MFYKLKNRDSKKKIRTIKGISILIISFFFVIVSVFGSGALSVVLANQNPTIVSPGNFVYLNIKVSNSGSTAIPRVSVTFENNNIFSVASGFLTTQNLGTIPTFSSTFDGSSYVIAKFKIKVAQNAIQGLNTFKILVNSNSKQLEYKFNVMVENKNPTIEIKKFDMKTLKPGNYGNLSIEIYNPNNIKLQNVNLNLNLNNVTGKILSIKGGSNQINIPFLNPKSSKNVTFSLIANPMALAMPYTLPVEITYKDSLGNSYKNEILGSIIIYSPPQLTVKLNSQSSFLPFSSSQISLAVANSGINRIQGTQITIEPNKNYEILNGAFQYIGDLNPDDFQTTQSTILFKSKNNFNLKVNITYLDSYNNKISKIEYIPVIITNSINAPTSNSKTTYYIILIVAILIAFFIGKRFGKKSLKNN